MRKVGGNVVNKRAALVIDMERNRYLQTLHEVAPSVLRALYSDVLPVYEAAYKVGGPAQTLRTYTDLDLPNTWADIKTEHPALKKALCCWAKDNDVAINDEWILDRAVSRLRRWALNGNHGGELLWSPQFTSRPKKLPKAERQFHFIDDGWEAVVPIGPTRLAHFRQSAYRRRVLARFRSELDSYLERMLARYVQLGYTEPLGKRDDTHHYVWLALRHDGVSIPAIANAFHKSPTAVGDGTLRLAKKIGLTLPKPKRGRRSANAQRN